MPALKPPSCLSCGSPDAEVWATAKDLEYKTSDDAFTLHRCHACGVLFIDPVPVLYPVRSDVPFDPARTNVEFDHSTTHPFGQSDFPTQPNSDAAETSACNATTIARSHVTSPSIQAECAILTSGA